ncbi:nucleoside-diphosphate kinase [bacterium]|nr:nucleoside-diphosphate kinase [bacterium]
MVEQSLVILKPEVLRRGIAGRIISRFEDRGIEIKAMTVTTISRETASQHYAEHREKPFFQGLVDYITSGPVVIMIARGEGVIGAIRKMVGVTNPANAEAGSIRGDFALTVAENAVHASDSPESAEREIKLFFS